MKNNNLVVKTNKRIKNFGLALGGGGARGFSHIGALKAFEEHNITFDYIAGTSVGSIVGACIAAGKTADEILEIALALRERDIRKNFLPLAPSKTDGIENILKNFLGDIEFDDLKIPFTAVAVDIKRGEEAHITKGNLAKAVAGSCAVPGIFTPVEFGDMLLFDGGLSNTIPTNVPKLNNCQVTIGIDINSTRGSGTESKKYFELLGASIGVMMKSNTIKGYLNADIMIKPALQEFKSSSLFGAREMYEEGYRATIEKIPSILKLFARKKQRSFTRIFPFKAKNKKQKKKASNIKNVKGQNNTSNAKEDCKTKKS